MQERKIIALLRERGRAGAARPAGTRWAAVRYVIVPILRDPQEREECLSEVTMRVWEKIDPFQEERGSWNGWLTSLTRHAALNHARRISRHGGAEALSEDPPSPGADAGGSAFASGAADRPASGAGAAIRR